MRTKFLEPIDINLNRMLQVTSDLFQTLDSHASGARAPVAVKPERYGARVL